MDTRAENSLALGGGFEPPQAVRTRWLTSASLASSSRTQRAAPSLLPKEVAPALQEVCSSPISVRASVLHNRCTAAVCFEGKLYSRHGEPDHALRALLETRVISRGSLARESQGHPPTRAGEDGGSEPSPGAGGKAITDRWDMSRSEQQQRR